MLSRLGITLFVLAVLPFSAGCGKQDFCKHLSLREAQTFHPAITNAKMRQTKRILYCVWGDGTSDKLFISVDRAMNHSPQDFLKVLAKNSPEEKHQVITLPGVGTEAAALFLGNVDPLKLDFLIAQNSKYSVTIRAPNVTSADTQQLNKLKEIASTVLSRI